MEAAVDRWIYDVNFFRDSCSQKRTYVDTDMKNSLIDEEMNEIQ